MKVEVEKKILDKIEEITMTDYETEGNKVPADNIESMLDDLLREIEKLEERIEDLNNYLQEEYNDYA